MSQDDAAMDEAATTDAATDPAPMDLSPDDLLADYRLAWESRHASLIGRREVLTGKAKFGIFGDGKELPQLALARSFRNGDWRSGYYRDQTFALATGMMTLEELFSQLYADPDPAHEPMSSGRQMNCHFATRSLDESGDWLDLTGRPMSAADSSPTGSQMPRLVGLAYASRLYRELPEIADERFSKGGDEVAFGTIGNASCAEGMLWEAVNAVGVLRSPLVLSIWDDGYGISVPNEHQVTKGDLSALLSGFQRDVSAQPNGGDPGETDPSVPHPTEPEPGEPGAGFDLYTVRGWDYPALVQTYRRAVETARRDHVPAILHVIELTQPQGHSTSGSHERYKSAERLEWETERDGLVHFRRLLLDRGVADEATLDRIESEAKERVQEAQRTAWQRFLDPIRSEIETAADQIETATGQLGAAADPDTRATLERLAADLRRKPTPFRRHIAVALHEAIVALRAAPDAVRRPLIDAHRAIDDENRARYASQLHAEGERSALFRATPSEATAPEYADDAPLLNGFEVLNAFFAQALEREPRLIAFGEDVGHLGDVNQGLAGLQERFGALRVSDTGIRECTILGQAIGMAMRGLRPLCEIQYLDYIHYALQLLSDDLATLRWRTRGGQAAPVIVRTRGHRLEGVWHSGSPMAGILNLVRGIWLCVPRDMTRAAGMYATLLRSQDPAIVVEVLNGYRVKERLPQNLDTFAVPLGVPEVLREGADVTVVTYGACCRIALDAAERLERVGIDTEVVDVQTLLPFDLPGVIGESLRKTNRLLVLDEDVPGGATAYMLRQILEEQNGFHWLDEAPRTLSAAAHRPAYGSDGDYWSKPSVESVFDAVYELMHAAAPATFPRFAE